MDGESQRIFEEFTQSTAHSGVNGSQPPLCSLCQKILSPDTEVAGDLETIGICGDCKFLLLEDLGTPTHESHHRRPPSRRRTRYNSSSESIENLFSQQFSQMINLARQTQSTVSGLEDSPGDGDATTRLPQRTSSRTTPRGSRRWRRVLSDTESDGFDNADSLYAESESNVSFGRYRVFHVESDAVSFSTYGGDSDASVDLHGFLDPEMFTQPNEGSDFDSDTDIDPMHAGLDQWNSDELEEEGGGGEEEEEGEEEEGEEEDGEWEEVDGEENTVDSTEARARLQNFLFSSQSESNYAENWSRQTHSPESEGMIQWRANSQLYAYDIFSNLEESEFPPYVGNSGDYLDARGFEDLLQHLAEADNSRRGAPPASVSYVNSLPRVVINKEHGKHDDLACAICKDVLSIGTEVNQLPCKHLYHPSCILPWLSARNSCPLCRYELPTDDIEYEEGKQNIINRAQIHNVQQDASEDSSSNVSVIAEEDGEHVFSGDRSEQREVLDVETAINDSVRESGRGRWFFLAAAPIVGLVGIVLVFWLGNPLSERRGAARLPEQGRQQILVSGSSLNQRENRSRRWWSLF